MVSNLTTYLVFPKAFREESVSEHVTIRITLATMIPGNKNEKQVRPVIGECCNKGLERKIYKKVLSVLTFHLSEKPGVVETCWPR